MHNVKNKSFTYLSVELNVGETVMQVSQDVFPDVPFWLSINNEIVEVLAKSGTTFTVNRGSDNTIPADHTVGTPVILNVVAGLIEELHDPTDKVPENHVHTEYSPIVHSHGYASEDHRHDPNEINEDSGHRFVSDTERTTWNGKQDEIGFVPLNTNKKGVADGYVPLGSSGKVPIHYIPANSRQGFYIVADEIERDSLTPSSGEKSYQEDNGQLFIYDGSNWEPLTTPVTGGDPLEWGNISSKPGSSVSDIDDAVTKKHEHANLDILNGITSTKVTDWNSSHSHISVTTGNPHSVTKDQVGLGGVQNYSVATDVEAIAGTASDKYMTPLRTKEAIQGQAVTSVRGSEEGAGRTGDVVLGYADVGAHPDFIELTAFNRAFGNGNTDVARGDHTHNFKQLYTKTTSGNEIYFDIRS